MRLFTISFPLTQNGALSFVAKATLHFALAPFKIRLHYVSKAISKNNTGADPGFWNGGWIVVILGWIFDSVLVGSKYMNKLIGSNSHRLCTFSTSIREIKYYFDIWGIRKKRKKGAQKKRGRRGGGWKFTHFTSPGSAPEWVMRDAFITLVSVTIFVNNS